MNNNFLENKYFLRLVDVEGGGCVSQHGKILSADSQYALVKLGNWDEDKPTLIYTGFCTRLLPIIALCDEYCSFFETFEELLAAELSLQTEDNDEFASKWEAKMNENNS